MKDPVCGMEVSDHGGNCIDWQNQHICFCSDTCMQTFKEHPEQYMGQKGGQWIDEEEIEE